MCCCTKYSLCIVHVLLIIEIDFMKLYKYNYTAIVLLLKFKAILFAPGMLYCNQAENILSTFTDFF